MAILLYTKKPSSLLKQLFGRYYNIMHVNNLVYYHYSFYSFQKKKTKNEKRNEKYSIYEF